MVKKHLGILDRDKPKEQLFNMVKMQTTHVKLQYCNITWARVSQN